MEDDLIFSCKQKTTSIFLKMEDDLKKKLKMGEDLKKIRNYKMTSIIFVNGTSIGL